MCKDGKEESKLLHTFFQQGEKIGLWSKKNRLLLAISGGVDSMVLLHLIEQLQKKIPIDFAVAHVNHKIREESIEEAAYVCTYCKQKNIPYYETSWEEAKDKNIEARARKFRYSFFANLMKQERYTHLLTAHHLDDQAETMLMKMVRGTTLKNLAGIQLQQDFSIGKLVRPFLIFSKEQIRNYAIDKKIMYFEDNTNYSDSYARNRMRHQIIPLLKQENKQFLEHMAGLSQQITAASSLIDSMITPYFNQWVHQSNAIWYLQLDDLLKQTEEFQLFFLMDFFQRILIPENVLINQAQMKQALTILNGSTPQAKMIFGSNWHFIRTYNCVKLYQKTETTFLINKNSNPLHNLNLFEGVFLSDKEWMGLETSCKKVPIPPKAKFWETKVLNISAKTSLPLIIRHRLPGDKIAIAPKLTKKLRRLFIDRKIPNEIREQVWIIADKNQEIIWIPNFVNSYLSIETETDKIHYRLLFKFRE
ncbi:tRNA lysidine(34) synthetase TilS [Melissococcus plutonius]|uniref:tRNA lysidine(34) synthetase TilS n=1 Tax=Melissococcus plutonius TaxID=33970 RepID=UPI003C2DF404